MSASHNNYLLGSASSWMPRFLYLIVSAVLIVGFFLFAMIMWVVLPPATFKNWWGENDDMDWDDNLDPDIDSDILDSELDIGDNNDN